MFDFIKNIFKKGPQEEQVVEVEVKAKRKYKPRAPKDKVEDVAVAEPVVIAEAPVEPPKPRIMARQLVGAATPVAKPVEAIVEPVAEPVVEEVVKKAPARKKPVAKKPVEVKAEEPVVETKAEPVVAKVAPSKPENKPKAVQNKPPRGKKKKR